MIKVSHLALSVLSVAVVAANAAAGTSININLSGFLPPPPGVHIYMEGERPYYRDHDRVVYLERVERRHKEKRGHAYGHREHEHDEGHGNHDHGRHGRRD